MKSKAMVLEAFRESLSLIEVEIPPLEEGQILVKLQASGVCGSDVHMWNGEDPRVPLPIILGHEGVGTVVDLKGVKRTVDGDPINPGDNIIWNRGVTCGKCYYCTVLKEPSLCENRRVYGINIPLNEKPYLNGCYAEHIILRTGTDIFTAPENINPSILVSSSCSGATCAHAFDMLTEHLTGKTVVVQGPGPLGVWAVVFARSLGAFQVFVIGGSTERLELCKDFGATNILNRHETTPGERKSAVLSVTHGRGADLVIEAVGAHGAVEEGIGLLRKGGTYLSTGYAQPAGLESIDFYRDVVFRNIRIQGVWVNDTSHLKQAINLIQQNPTLFEKLITQKFSLEETNEALIAMKEKKVVKAVLEM
ncbi:MAG: zinc-binding dehydrogenase [Candidatus Latescibacteria bacterium]|nr:zinc-binding dehydrogenase [Candidatus Latescibacterota bacterium]